MVNKSYEVLKECPICDGKIKCSNGVRLTTFSCKDNNCIYVTLRTNDKSLVRLSCMIDDCSDPHARKVCCYAKTPSMLEHTLAGTRTLGSYMWDSIENGMHFDKLIEPDSFATKEDLINYYNKLMRLAAFK